MNLHLTDPWWLLVLPPVGFWILWLTLTSEVQASFGRRWSACAVRLVVVLALAFALAGLRWNKAREGMNVFFLLDRSDSVPPAQQEFAREYVGQSSRAKQPEDNVGVLVFGSEASIESSPLAVVRSDTKIYAVVGGERTDIASAIRLGTAAFPESGQKRLVLLSDGQQNVGDALSAARTARSLDVSLDVLALGALRNRDVSVQKVALPGNVKRGQTFEIKIFVESHAPGEAALRLYLNEGLLGEQSVRLEAGKNLFTLPQTLTDPGFYRYEVRLDATNDAVPQNNRATSFTHVRGDPRILIISAQPDRDEALAAAVKSADVELSRSDIGGFPGTLAELQSYDAIFLSNVAAGDLGDGLMRLLESAVRDFGVGLVCVGGDQSFAAGSYRGTPLERMLPVDMELSSRKVLPPGAIVLVMHGMEFNGGNQIARDCAIGVLEALGPQDEMGVVLWDGHDRWLFELQPVGDKRAMRQAIAGMNQGDLPTFQNVLSMAHAGLKESRASLKHILVFSDGDPAAPSPELMRGIVESRITVSSVLIAGHAGPETMIDMAQQGRGRFYHVTAPRQLPQVFIKETAVILKSAISEEPFRPQLTAVSEAVRGIAADEYPILRGYVATSRKARAETPLVTDKGDPLLAHWQYGLGRAAAFTSDAQARWAGDWLAWPRYRQFWTQLAAWSLRRVENTEWMTDVTVDRGEGRLSVDALGAEGEYENFLDLQAVVVNPSGEQQLLRLQQTGPGHYETRFPTREVGAYLLNVSEIRNGRPVSSQVVGASVNYSPEFSDSNTNLHLLRSLADAGGGRVLSAEDPQDNPFVHARIRTYQPVDLWETLLVLAILLFPVDVGLRRIYLDREEWRKVMSQLRRWATFWRSAPVPAPADFSLTALLARRNQLRAQERSASAAAPSQGRGLAAEAGSPAHEKRVPPPTPLPRGESGPPSESVSTTRRLLEAKRRAKRRGR